MLNTRVLGENIKNLRKKNGLTQQSFAEALGISFQAVSNWERGIAPPDLENLLRIADVFGVMVDDLVRAKGGDLFLGIDGGGTKTELAVVTSDGYVIKHMIKEGCNPNDIGYTRAMEILTDGIERVLIKYPSVKAAFLGVAGAGSGNYAKRIETELKKRYPNLAFAIKNDAYNLFSIDDSADMAVISGTGSVVFARDNDEYKRLGGWGHLFEDGGSAFSIGKDAIKVALLEEDMHQSHSLLSTLLCKKLNTATVWESINTVYSGGKPFVAGLASVVFEAYALKDENAKRIIDDNARSLAKLLNTGIRLYGANGVAIASGGIFEHYGDVMKEHIAKYSSACLNITDLPPIYGACKKACTVGECEITDEFYENFKKTYGGR